MPGQQRQSFVERWRVRFRRSRDWVPEPGASVKGSLAFLWRAVHGMKPIPSTALPARSGDAGPL
jgi:hypothetical protein